ncbi:hypothetical protein NDU88_002640 [Pleurodeles waltl]|uniref:Uncharacterized protein n=1 Tax=Pleurodeles waltl TaxID=8319 RepID=A0AAV7SDI2_PLEWA|nr:hypothetical protein NDU88_002640 [Pleurodeles waltl]
MAVQAKIEAISLDVGLLSVDLCMVVERSLATEQRVNILQDEVSSLRMALIAFTAKTETLECRAEDGVDRSRSCKLHFVGFPKDGLSDRGAVCVLMSDKKLQEKKQRRCLASHSSQQVVVWQHGTLALEDPGIRQEERRRHVMDSEQWRSEREEARALVEEVTASGSDNCRIDLMEESGHPKGP